MTSLVADAVTFAYAGPPVLDGFSHAFPPGLTWLRGDNGCGKSTLLRLLGGALAPRAGSIRFDGHDAVADPIEYRRHVQWSGPDGPAFDHLKPREYFSFVAGLYPAFDVAVADALTAALGLEPFLPRRIRELSTGSRRKVATIAAIAANTPVVLLDEPLAALDLASSRVVRRRLAEAAGDTDRVWVVASHEPLDDGAHVLALPSRA